MRYLSRSTSSETTVRSFEIAARQSSRERDTACRLSKHTLKIWKRNGTGLWPDLHVTAAHHISGFNAGFRLSSLLWHDASHRVGDGDAYRGAFGIIGERRRRQRENGRCEKEEGQKEKQGVKGGGYVSTRYAGNINTAGLSNEPECDLRIFQRVGGLAWNRAPTEQSHITCHAAFRDWSSWANILLFIYFFCVIIIIACR